MAIDNTHTKYLHGNDKKVWNNYKEAFDAQKKLDNFLGNLKIPDNLEEGEEYDIPIHKNKK